MDVQGKVKECGMYRGGQGMLRTRVHGERGFWRDW